MNIVIVDCFDTWEHRANLLYKAFTEEGHKVRVLISDYRHIEKAYRTDNKKDFRFFHAERYDRNLSVARMRSHIRLSRSIFSFIDRHSSCVDLLWVLAPPNVFVRDAVGVKQRNPGMKLVIDLIDLWPESLPMGVIKPLLKPWKRLRDRYLKHADMIVTECSLYKAVLGKALDGADVRTLYLAREDKGYEPHLDFPDDRINLCYLGSINNIIDIPAIGGVIEECRKVKAVELHIIGDGEKKDELIRTAENAGARVIDHGKVYDRVMKQKIFDTCHYGLNIMKKSVCVGLTMKSVDYFEFGLPIINSIHGDTWDIIEKHGCGVNVEKNYNFLNSGSRMHIVNDKEYENIRYRCRKIYNELFSASVITRKIYGILGDVSD